MEFPKTIPCEDMDLFLKECRLTGLDIVRFKTVKKIQIGERTQWLVLYQLAGDEWVLDIEWDGSTGDFPPLIEF